jgi:hypothetical protein
MSAPVLAQPVRRSQVTNARRVLSWWHGAMVVVAGLVVGIGTQYLQGVLPDGWGVLANSGAAWAMCAFAVGAVLPTPRLAAVGGALHLVVASVVYYASVDWFESAGSGNRAAVVWSAAGLVSGPVFGVAGHWFARRAERRDAVLALVSGVLAGEGMHLVRLVGNPDLRAAGLVELCVAAVLGLAGLVRSSRSRLPSSTALVVALVLGAATVTLMSMRVIDAVFVLW